MELEINEDKVECPVCGKVIVDMEVGESNPCKHVKLIYSDACGEIVHNSNDISTKDYHDIERKLSDTDTDYDICDLLIEAFSTVPKCSLENKMKILNAEDICRNLDSCLHQYLLGGL